MSGTIVQAGTGTLQPGATDSFHAGDTRAALELATGALAALMARTHTPDTATVTFTGRWAHLGTVTLGNVLDAANRALADTPPPPRAYSPYGDECPPDLSGERQ